MDIRNEGSLTGDVVAQRISIEDGAFFKGGIDIRKPNANEKPQAETPAAGGGEAGDPGLSAEAAETSCEGPAADAAGLRTLRAAVSPRLIFHVIFYSGILSRVSEYF